MEKTHMIVDEALYQQNCQPPEDSEYAATADGKHPQQLPFEGAQAGFEQNPSHTTSTGRKLQIRGSGEEPGASREAIQQNAQELIDELNTKRKRDGSMLNDFKAILNMETDAVVGRAEAHLMDTYERHGRQVEKKLQQLFATLDRIAKLENELHQFKKALSELYADMS